MTSPEQRDDRFWFGLGCVLEGIAVAIAAASAPPA
jgi:hypothetical protein